MWMLYVSLNMGAERREVAIVNVLRVVNFFEG